MSNYAEHPDLTLNERLVWREAKGKEHVYKYIVQKAPTARARCRKCSQLVEKGELRVGMPIRHNAGDNGWISAWQHLSCTRVADINDYESDMQGFAKLNPEEQELVKKEVTSSEVPDHLKPLDPDDLVRRGGMAPLAAPPTLLRPLLAYQKEGMGWMVRQEAESDIKGGILADEMGMGKTIQTIGMMLSHRVNGPTLVVCPVSSMLQWEAEIKEHVVPGSLTVVVVYRTTKVTKEDLENADVVLTTYPMLELAWRGLINEIKVPCPYCGLLFIPRQLVVHNKYFCGPRAKKTQKQAKREKNVASTEGKTRRVQSAETIRKGLKTLHVDLEEGEQLPGRDRVDVPSGQAPPQRRRGRSAAGAQDDGDAAPATSNGGAAVKREKREVGQDSSSAEEGVVKKEEGESGMNGAEDVKAVKSGLASSAATARGVVGPIGMYQELMREAGRTVRSRWDPVRKAGDSGSSSSEEEEEEANSSSDDSDDDASSDSSYDAAAAEAEEKAADERASEALAAFRCPECHFQLLRYPFCPKTGQHHIVPEGLRDVIEKDTGGDDVDLNASIFHRIKWARVILDEAHRIKGRTTSTARSAFALTADYRWCLTGTPLQNRVGDLYSLLRFLRMRPYAHYYCGTEGCSCSSLSHPFSSTSLRQCVFCGHGPLQHHSYFNRYILNPINRYGYIGDGRRGMMMLSNDVFHRAMLRRTKVERAADLKLPSMTIEVRPVDLTKEERNFYESLYKRSTAEFDTFVHKGTVLHNYAHIFQLLSRLRQALDNPLLVMQGMDVGKVVNVKGVCGVCGEGIEGESVIKVHPCRHQFHRLCLGQFLESAPDKEFHCPTCFVRINVDLRQLRQDLEEDEDGGDGGGVMAAALPPELQEDEEDEDGEADDSNAEKGNTGPTNKANRRRSGAANGKKGAVKKEEGDGEDNEETLASQFAQASKAKRDVGPTKKEQQSILARLDPQKPLHGTKLDAIADYIEQVPKDEKVIVFSQFGSMLDLTQYWLQRRFIKAVKLCGSLTLGQRQSVLQAFLHDPSVRVILISLKAGGEGLNLQVANHVVLTDPWWNPAVEMQAVQRAHRIGQTRPVHAVRFVTRHSVEERMVDLQDKKMLVFEGTIDGKLQSLNKLSEEDLQFLFTR